MLICEVTPAIRLKASVKVLLEGFKNTVHLSGAAQHQRTSEFKSYKYVRGYFQAILASLTVKWTQPSKIWICMIEVQEVMPFLHYLIYI